jgi:hypothetical protein
MCGDVESFKGLQIKAIPEHPYWSGKAIFLFLFDHTRVNAFAMSRFTLNGRPPSAILWP